MIHRTKNQVPVSYDKERRDAYQKNKETMQQRYQEAIRSLS